MSATGQEVISGPARGQVDEGYIPDALLLQLDIPERQVSQVIDAGANENLPSSQANLQSPHDEQIAVCPEATVLTQATQSASVSVEDKDVFSKPPRGQQLFENKVGDDDDVRYWSDNNDDFNDSGDPPYGK